MCIGDVCVCMNPTHFLCRTSKPKNAQKETQAQTQKNADLKKIFSYVYTTILLRTLSPPPT